MLQMPVHPMGRKEGTHEPVRANAARIVPRIRAVEVWHGAVLRDLANATHQGQDEDIGEHPGEVEHGDTRNGKGKENGKVHQHRTGERPPGLPAQTTVIRKVFAHALEGPPASLPRKIAAQLPP